MRHKPFFVQALNILFVVFFLLEIAAKGNAMIALNSVDFGNFITHPLMKPPGLPGASDSSQDRIKFSKDNVRIDPANGAITFFGSYLGEMWRCTLQRGSGAKKAVVTVEPTDTSSETMALASQLTRVVSDFFNDMVFELDGVYLMFRDMMVTPKGDAPSVMLALQIVVEKFPSAGLAF